MLVSGAAWSPQTSSPAPEGGSIPPAAKIWYDLWAGHALYSRSVVLQTRQ